jgi:RNA polymerase sigma-70 factor (ECF subfamily)
MPAGKLTQSDLIGSLYSEHHGWLISWLRKKLGCPQNAADLAQDAFLRLVARQDDPSRFREPRAYLTSVAKNLVVDYWRRREIERAYLEAIAHLPEPEAPSPETRFLVLEALLKIDAVLGALPPEVRKVFLLSQLDGLTYPEIAARLGASLATVKRHMRRAFLACLANG